MARAGSPSPSLAMANAAAPSLAPQALPAVMREALDFRVQRLERGQLLHAGVPARMLVDREQPVRRLDGNDLLLEAALVDRARSRCGATAAPSASISSRLTPALTAAFQPTVIDMSRLGASGRSGWVGGNQSTHSPSTCNRDRGDVDAEFTPPAMIELVHARAHARRRALHRRLARRAVPVVGQARRPWEARGDGRVPGDHAAAVEALAQDHVVDLRRVQIRRAASDDTWCARSNALVSRSVPLRAVPIGVRRADTMTASGTGLLQFSRTRENTILSGRERPVARRGERLPHAVRRDDLAICRQGVLCAAGRDDRGPWRNVWFKRCWRWDRPSAACGSRRAGAAA